MAWKGSTSWLSSMQFLQLLKSLLAEVWAFGVNLDSVLRIKVYLESRAGYLKTTAGCDRHVWSRWPISLSSPSVVSDCEFCACRNGKSSSVHFIHCVCVFHIVMGNLKGIWSYMDLYKEFILVFTCLNTTSSNKNCNKWPGCLYVEVSVYLQENRLQVMIYGANIYIVLFNQI